jgi:4-amino-4-deoxy-L-arabinose transferase-like glycosyltransferase
MKNMNMKNIAPISPIIMRHPWLMVVIILTLSVSIKLILIWTDRMPFNADEAVVGLMADHILKGEVPVFFWGQSYMGSLDALFVAWAFTLFGRSVMAIRIVQILLFCGTIATTYVLAYRISQRVEAGWMAAILLAMPAVTVTLYTTISLGGYGESLLLGNLILLTGVALLSKNARMGWLCLGFLSGLGLWVNGLTLVYSVPVIAILVWRIQTEPGSSIMRKRWVPLAILIAGGLAGAFPWLLHGYQDGFSSLLTELMGSAIASQKTGYLQGVGNRLVSFLLFGLTVIFGFRPPWEIRWLALPLIPLVAGIWTMILAGCRKTYRKLGPAKDRVLLLWGVILILILGFIITSFGNDPSGRYFVPLAVPLSILAGDYLGRLSGKMVGWRWLILGFILVFHTVGTVQCWLAYPPGFTTQFDTSTVHDQRDRPALIEFLSENSLDRGYTTYWISYPLAFLSDESLIYVPRLPYHRDFAYTSRDSRYEPYEALVRSADQISYITANQPWLDEYLRDRFTELNINWREQKVGEFQVFFGFDRIVTPEEIGLEAVE